MSKTVSFSLFHLAAVLFKGVNNNCFWFCFFTSRKYTLKAFLRCWDFHSCSRLESLTYLLFDIFWSGFHQALAVRLIIRCFQGFHWKDRLWFPTTATKSRCRGWCKTKRKIHCLGEKRETAIVLKVRIKISVSKSIDGAVVGTLAFHQSGAGVIWPSATCALSLLLVLAVLWGFFSGFKGAQCSLKGVVLRCLWSPPPFWKPFLKQTTNNIQVANLVSTLCLTQYDPQKSWLCPWGSIVLLPTQKPTSPNSNLTRIENSHENQLRLVWVPL